jgi:hypothetical protein
MDDQDGHLQSFEQVLVAAVPGREKRVLSARGLKRVGRHSE